MSTDLRSPWVQPLADISGRNRDILAFDCDQNESVVTKTFDVAVPDRLV